jgi:hypothetical protein
MVGVGKQLGARAVLAAVTRRRPVTPSHTVKAPIARPALVFVTASPSLEDATCRRALWPDGEIVRFNKPNKVDIFRSGKATDSSNARRGAAAPLRSIAGSRVGHQDSPDHLRRNGEEMLAVLPLNPRRSIK